MYKGIYPMHPSVILTAEYGSLLTNSSWRFVLKRFTFRRTETRFYRGGDMKKVTISAITLAFCLFCAHLEAAPTYSFVNITNNNAGDAAIGEAQLFVELFDLNNQANFAFTNIGPAASSITDVYFDNGSLLGIASIINTPTLVEFSQLATPPDLPGGNAVIPPFETTTGFSADSNPPVQPLGVNPGESLGIIFDLQGGHTFTDVLDELESGELRIGIHVQGYASGGSESFINNGIVDDDGVIPAPGALILCSIGASCLGWLRRRRML
jgi:hypothetical protein